MIWCYQHHALLWKHYSLVMRSIGFCVALWHNKNHISILGFNTIKCRNVKSVHVCVKRYIKNGTLCQQKLVLKTINVFLFYRLSQKAWIHRHFSFNIFSVLFQIQDCFETNNRRLNSAYTQMVQSHLKSQWWNVLYIFSVKVTNTNNIYMCFSVRRSNQGHQQELTK